LRGGAGRFRKERRKKCCDKKREGKQGSRGPCGTMERSGERDVDSRGKGSSKPETKARDKEVAHWEGDGKAGATKTGGVGGEGRLNVNEEDKKGKEDVGRPLYISGGEPEREKLSLTGVRENGKHPRNNPYPKKKKGRSRRNARAKKNNL